MTTHVFQASTRVSARPDVLFSFHENPENIRKIAPASLKICSVECASVAVEGGQFRIRASQFGLPIDWTGRWERVERPGILVDAGVRSPFQVWRHSHVFQADGDGSVMTDRVDYLLKGGVAGELVSRWILPLVFREMFRARHEATRRYFAGNQ